jgi:hypothetical protein
MVVVIDDVALVVNAVTGELFVVRDMEIIEADSVRVVVVDVAVVVTNVAVFALVVVLAVYAVVVALALRMRLSLRH